MQPSEIMTAVLRAAPSADTTRFVYVAIDTYFQRVIEASWRKLTSHGLRPIVAPVAAEIALERATEAGDLAQFLMQLIDGDELVADLVARAVRFYAARFSRMTNDEVHRELGTSLPFDISAAACTVWRNLSFICSDDSPLNSQ